MASAYDTSHSSLLSDFPAAQFHAVLDYLPDATLVINDSSLAVKAQRKDGAIGSE